MVSARSGQHGVTRALPPRCHCQTLLWALMVVQGYCVSEKVDVPIARGLTTAMVTNPICRIRRWWEKGVDSSERVASCHERPRGSVGVRSPSPDPTWCSRGKFLSIEPSKGERYSIWPRRVLSLGRHHCAICKVGATAARILIQRRWDGVYPSFVGSNPTWDLPKRFETHQPGACCTASNGLRSRDTKRKPVRRRDTSAGEGRSEISEDRSVRRQMAVRARTQC